MSVTPITSNTARIGPPAMMPVTGLGRRHQHLGGAVAARSPVMDRCVLQLTLTMLRRAGVPWPSARPPALPSPCPCPCRCGRRRRRPRSAPRNRPAMRPPFTTFGDAVDRSSFRRPSSAFGLRAGLKLCHLRLIPQNCRPLRARLGQRLDAAVVIAKPARSNATFSMPAAFAFSAMRLPITAAAATLPPCRPRRVPCARRPRRSRRWPAPWCRRRR